MCIVKRCKDFTVEMQISYYIYICIQPTCSILCGDASHAPSQPVAVYSGKKKPEVGGQSFATKCHLTMQEALQDWKLKNHISETEKGLSRTVTRKLTQFFCKVSLFLGLHHGLFDVFFGTKRPSKIHGKSALAAPSEVRFNREIFQGTVPKEIRHVRVSSAKAM